MKLNFLKKLVFGVFIFLLLKINYAYSQYPTGYYPLWGQIIPDTTVVLKWNDVSGATSYNIQVATDVNFNVLVLNQSNITVDTLLITGLDKNTIYYWRVSVHTGPNSGVWSPLKMFRCFIPSGLPNLTLWLRADKGIVLSGSNVVIWQDQSGNAYNFSQSTSSNQPLLVANAINYLPAIKFDGTNDYLATSTPITGIDASSITLFCLAKGNSQSGGSSNAKSMFSIGTTATGFWLARNVSNQKLMLYNKGSSIITTATLPNTGFGYRIFGAVKTYASDTKVYQNDTLVGYSTNANIIGSFTNNNANIGGNSVTSGALYNGEIAEMVLYTSALNDNDRQIVERYLAAKYNKSYVNLGKDKIQNNKSLCSINLDAGFGFKSYLWSTGDTISNINVYSSGTYWVSVIDAFGYSSVDTINVNVFDIKLNCNDTTICYGTSLNISPVGITSQSGLSYLWSTGDTTSSIHVSSQGQYWVKVIDSIGCFKYSDTITVSVDMFPSTMTLGPDTSFCSGNYIKLLSPSSNFSNLVFNWSDGSNDSILVINYSGTYWVSVTNTNGCIAIDTINVIITGIAPQVNFLADTVCLGEYTHFTDLSVAAPLDNINQWLWSFGDGNNSNLQNPIYKYSNYGIYNVSLTATTIGGCYKTIVKQVLVNDSVGVYFTASPMNCINNYTFFFSQTLPGQNDSIMSYLWDFDDPSSGINNNSTLPEPQHMYMTPGTYNVSLTVYTYKGCTKTIILPVSVISSALLPGGFMLLNPVDSLIIDDTTITFSWSNSLNAYYYKLEIASDQSFNSIIASFTGIQNLYKTVNLSFNSGMYFWRIKAYNICGDSTISNVFCFQIFNSTTIPGMTLWYKVNSGVNVINNNEVLKWLDCSGNNKHAFQNTSSLRPTYIPNALNGWPVLHFGKTGQNGERTYLNFDTVKFTNGNFSIFTVYKAIDINKSFHYFLSGGTGTSFKGGCHAGGTYTGINGYGIYGVGGINGRNAAEEPINWGIVTYFNNKLYRNSKEANYSLQGTVNDIYINTIGTRLDYANFFFYGDIAEIIVYDNKLNTQQQAFIERYLHDKYAGPPVNLGPDITLTYGVCSVTLDAGNRFINYLWSTGDTTSKINVDNSGIYWVSVTDIFGYVSTDTIVINKPTVTVNDTILCIGSYINVSSGLGNNYNYLWSSGETTSAIVINTPGNKWVEVIDTIGCMVTKNFNVVADSFSSFVSLGQDTSLCSGILIGLVSGGNQAVSYLWNDGSTNNLMVLSNSGIYSVTVTNNNGCVANDSIYITISGIAPVVDFTSNNVCFGDSMYFNNLSYTLDNSIITNYQWSFGDNNNSTLQNPYHKYMQPGTYTVNLVAVTDVGCVNAISKDVTVNSLPNANFKPIMGCNGQQILFQDLSTGFSDIINWHWEFNDPYTQSFDTSILQNPYYVFDSVGNYMVTLTVIDTNGCISSISKNIIIRKTPEVDFSFSNSCLGSSTYFADITPVNPWEPIVSWYWDFGDGNFSDVSNPVHNYDSAKTYNVTLIVQSLNGCIAQIIKPVTLYAIPSADFIPNKVCLNIPEQFTDLSTVVNGNIDTWIWSLGNNILSYEQNPTFIFSDTGYWPINLQVYTTAGCYNSISKYVYVSPVPLANFSFTPDFGIPPLTVAFTNESTGGYIIHWDFGDGNFSDENTPQHIYSDTGKYYITLTVTNDFGCSSSIVKDIYVMPFIADVSVYNAYVNQNNNMLSFYADVVNLGTINLRELEMKVRLSGGIEFSETWKGFLTPGSYMNYPFSAKYKLSSYNPDYICITAEIPDFNPDDRPYNNENCIGNTVDFTLMIYPNPVKDELTVDIVVPDDEQLKMQILTSTGAQTDIYSKVEANNGFNRYKLNLASLSKGIYALKVDYKDKVNVKMFFKE